MSKTNVYSMKPIGFVESVLKNRREAPKQGNEGAPDAWIRIVPGFAPAAKGIAPGQEVYVITWLHQARREVLRVHPRSDKKRPLTGVFATRSPDRPNPLGLHRVRVLEVARKRIKIGPLEAIDGTPVVDIKPILCPEGAGKRACSFRDSWFARNVTGRLRRRMEPLLLDLALARRIELAEAQAAASAAEVMMRLKPEMAPAVERIAGGLAVFCGANSPVTQAVGLGLDGPVSDEECERLEEFYRSRNEPVRVETCPLADMTLFEHFGVHGYRATEFTNVMARRVTKAPEFAARGREVSVERVEEKHLEGWNLTVAQGFAEHLPVTQEILDIMKMFALAPGNECYLARVDGKVAGGATLALRDGIAGLFGASTLPAYRNRGVQAALLRARLERATEAGCELAACLARPGSTSQRNIVRHGFQVLYTRVKFERDLTAATGKQPTAKS